MKLIAFGQNLAVVAGAAAVIVVPVPRPMRPWRISFVSKLAAAAGNPGLFGIKSVSIGGAPLTFNPAGVDVPSTGFSNRNPSGASSGSCWDLTDDFGNDLQDIPPASSEAGLVVEVVNREAAAADMAVIVCLMD